MGRGRGGWPRGRAEAPPAREGPTWQHLGVGPVPGKGRRGALSPQGLPPAEKASLRPPRFACLRVFLHLNRDPRLPGPDRASSSRDCFMDAAHLSFLEGGVWPFTLPCFGVSPKSAVDAVKSASRETGLCPPPRPPRWDCALERRGWEDGPIPAQVFAVGKSPPSVVGSMVAGNTYSDGGRVWERCPH